VQLLDGAEAKAYWGLALNYKPLQALVDVLVAEETINGERLTEVMTPDCAGLITQRLHAASCNVTSACVIANSMCRAGVE
jgi:hypothetical protein